MKTDIAPTQFVSRPRDTERLTRKPLPWWDRVKILAVLALVFGLSVWGAVGDNPILPVQRGHQRRRCATGGGCSRSWASRSSARSTT